MARKPRAEMIEETRAKLIEAARRAFADNGYAGASMDELTASAGLTRGALYHHFGDKKGLLAAVVQQIDDEMNLRLGAILAAGEDLWSGFRAYTTAPTWKWPWKRKSSASSCAMPRPSSAAPAARPANCAA